MASTGDISSLNNLISRLKYGQPAQIVLDSLTRIRSEFIRRSDGVEEFRRLGGLKPLLTLISTPNERIVDVSLSILANCCMEEKTRIQVKRLNGIKPVVSILKTLKQTSILNRAARTLANLAIDPNIAEFIHLEEGAVATLVSLLQNAEDDECRQSVIRALRQLSKTEKHRDIVIEAEGIQPIAELLKSKHTGVIVASVRAVAEMTKNCDLNCVRQVTDAEGLASLVDLITHAKTVIREHAVLSLFNLMSHGIVRPSVGSAGGIKAFIGDIKKATNTATLSVQLLCVSCREVVNRVKIRELGGLELMIEMLKLDEYATHHETIIASFLCFVYDDKSLDVMVTNDVVSVLLTHLHRAIGTENQQMSADSSMDVSDLVKPSKAGENPETEVTAVEITRNEAIESDCVPSETDYTSSESAVCDELKTPSVGRVDHLASTPQSKRQCSSGGGPTSWPGLETPGTTRAFSPYLSPPGDHDTTAQYASPSYSYSPQHKMSPYASWSPPGSVFSVYSDTSDPGFQPEMSPVHHAEETDEVFEDTADDRLYNPEVTPEESAGSSHVVREDAVEEADPSVSGEASMDNGVLNDTSSAVKGGTSESPAQSNSDDNTNVTTTSMCSERDFDNLQTSKTKTHVECPEPKGLEHNILLFLSRLSQIEDPSNILVTKPCLKSILGYIVSTSSIGNRAVRILTRLIRNPHCFESMVLSHAPSLIHLLLEKSVTNLPERDDPDFTSSPASDTSKECEASQDGKEDQADCLKYAELLLKNLSIQGETPYGQGVISHCLLAGSAQEKLAGAIAVPFIYRNSSLRKKMLTEYSALRTLVSAIRTLSHEDGEISTMAADALSHLSVEVGIAAPAVGRLPSVVKSRNVLASANQEIRDSTSTFISRDVDVCADPGQDSCAYQQSRCQSDIQFAVADGPKIKANREQIASSSTVFAAMLSGSYVESKQSVVTINEVTHQAFSFIVHHLYGCRLETCAVMQELLDTIEELELEILALSDRFMLPTLLELLHDVIIVRYFNFLSIVRLYRYCCLYHCGSLQEECLSFILTKETGIMTRVACFKELSQCSENDSAYDKIYSLIERNI
ncbi:armadillo repeat-containing protein 5-like [Ptychodera flava]|uniref:armadillo repeat-containing protein 5-like n=1 Tax=Ptychodera flava TaxID=63121 RepID=UPI00396A53B0